MEHVRINLYVNDIGNIIFYPLWAEMIWPICRVISEFGLS